MKLLITGATGFVGRNLLLSSLKRPEYSEIIVPVRSLKKFKQQLETEGVSRESQARIRPVIAEAPQWSLGLEEVNHVVHSAGVIFARTKEEYFQTNVEGTLTLLRQIKKVGKVVLLSSQSAAGPCGDLKFRTEQDTDSPLTWYGQSKLEMEKRVANEFAGLNYVCLRPPMIFGPRDAATLPLFKMVKKPFHFKPGFKAKRYSFISVHDLVEAIWKTLENEAPVGAQKHYFVASPDPITDETLITTAAKTMNRRGLLIRVPQPILWGASRLIDSIPTWRATIPSLSVDRAKEIWPDAWVVSPKAFQEKYGWSSKQGFESSLKETADWYRSSGQLD